MLSPDVMIFGYDISAIFQKPFANKAISLTFLRNIVAT